MSQQLLLVGGGGILGAVAGSVIGAGDLGAQAGQSIGNIAALSYSRDQEIEADRLGMRYMKVLKYDPMGAVEVQEILGRESGGSRPPEILSTHPASETRITELKKRFDKYHSDTVNNPEYQKFAERYQQRYLSISSRLPPAPGASARGNVTDGDRMVAMALVAQPSLWCGHCRETGVSAR